MALGAKQLKKMNTLTNRPSAPTSLPLRVQSPPASPRVPTSRFASPKIKEPPSNNAFQSTSTEGGIDYPTPRRLPTRMHSPSGRPRIPTTRDQSPPRNNALKRSDSEVDDASPYAALIAERRAASFLKESRQIRVSESVTSSLFSHPVVAYNPKAVSPTQITDDTLSVIQDATMDLRSETVSALRQQALKLKEEKSRGLGGMQAPHVPRTPIDEVAPDETVIHVRMSRRGSEVIGEYFKEPTEQRADDIQKEEVSNETDRAASNSASNAVEERYRSEIERLNRELAAVTAAHHELAVQQERAARLHSEELAKQQKSRVVPEQQAVSQQAQNQVPIFDVSSKAQENQTAIPKATMPSSHIDATCTDENVHQSALLSSVTPNKPSNHVSSWGNDLMSGIDSPYTLSRRQRQPILAPLPQIDSEQRTEKDEMSTKKTTDLHSADHFVRPNKETTPIMIVSPPPPPPAPTSAEVIRDTTIIMSLLQPNTLEGSYEGNIATLRSQFSEGVLDSQSYAAKNLPPLLKHELAPSVAILGHEELSKVGTPVQTKSSTGISETQLNLSPVVDETRSGYLPTEIINTYAVPKVITSERAKMFLREHVNPTSRGVSQKALDNIISTSAALAHANDILYQQSKGPSVILYPSGAAPSHQSPPTLPPTGQKESPALFDAHAFIKQARQYRNENCLRQQLTEEMFLKLHPSAGKPSTVPSVPVQVKDRHMRPAPPIPTPLNTGGPNNVTLPSFDASKFFAGANSNYFNVNRNTATDISAHEDFLRASPSRKRELRVFSTTEETLLRSREAEGRWHWASNVNQ